MCQRLYIASRTKLRTVRRATATSLLAVQDITEDARARKRFGEDKGFLYLAGAHVECGCGFPALPAEPDGPESKVDPQDAQSLQALAQYLREACKRHATVELHLCWVHEEPEAPLSRRTVSLSDLHDPAFRLRHREILTVGRAP